MGALTESWRVRSTPYPARGLHLPGPRNTACMAFSLGLSCLLSYPSATRSQSVLGYPAAIHFQGQRFFKDFKSLHSSKTSSVFPKKVRGEVVYTTRLPLGSGPTSWSHGLTGLEVSPSCRLFS